MEPRDGSIEVIEFASTLALDSSSSTKKKNACSAKYEPGWTSLRPQKRVTDLSMFFQVIGVDFGFVGA